MMQFDDQAGTPASTEQAEGLEVRIARQLLEQAKTEGVSLVGPGGLLAGVTKTVLQAALDAEMADHLGYERGDRPPFPADNHRNGTSPKTVLTEVGPIPLEVPRDRSGKFDPQIVPKHARRVAGFNEAIVSLYAKGLTTGDIRAHLGEIYGVEVSRDLISRVTDAVADELAAWQSRPLDRGVYPVLLIDAIFVKIRDGQVANRPVYVALGINCHGQRDVLGMWAGTGGEGAKAWMGILAELRNRGVEDCCIVACDGLKGLPEAIGEIWPQATVQLCVVYLVRANLRYASKNYWGQISKDLRQIYTAPPRPPLRPGSPSLSRPGARATCRHPALAVRVGAVHPVPGLPAGDPQDRVHDESDREPELPVPPGCPPTGALPRRAVRDQGLVPGHPHAAAQPAERDGQDTWLEGSHQRADHVLRRQDHPQLMAITAHPRNSGQSHHPRRLWPA